ncbi:MULTISPECIES: alpha/beta hydrolase [unclassified Rhodococcus (in: high G+C Gram-positive bacteria)]|uniref:alpha/beta hydrolase n=1 Tax=unclassified Rhodococcus (in: high G+C Gram-positive bacteria) TaxID=192944 RepID=UPI001639E148|nr:MULTISPECIES: alpha/beta hydrolase [unclassified Rhodococcus (in: high G+C Gram-positive bacteria)]MBC2640680.1 alpha/beta hydrolase [Rhodococcus sp. 3A]MBC2894575.1 alpha/beta hydrolase [Rhodococcus sp. 4CII]
MSEHTERLGAGRYIDAAQAPRDTVTTVHELATADGAKVTGVLRVVPGARTVVALMHPRQDLTHHVLVPELLARGYAVWTQGTRSVNNDLTLVHEQALLDAAAGQVLLRQKDFDHVITLGHSGGGALFAFYHEQAGLPSAQRLTQTPAGRPIDLAAAEMPLPDGAVFMAPHPGQGALLLRLIDPSVVDESDPLAADPDLDPFDPANGFAQPPHSSSYSPAFVTRYRAAQHDRIARLDEIARRRVDEAAAARRRYKRTSDPVDRRTALAPRVLTIYRTDADLRFADLSLSPNDRPYGSLFGRRPDLTNYGLVGFGRLTTPDAWLSTWSGLSSNADFVRCAPTVTAPTLFVELTGDQACFPEDAKTMVDALGSTDKTHVRVAGTHFGGPIADGAPTGAGLAAAEIGAWLADRFS